MADTSLHIVERLAEEYAARRRGGDSISVDEFVAEHPDHADSLRDFIEALQLINDFGKCARPPRSLIGPYEVVRELGRGGMGVVYLANDSRLDRQIAVKLLTHQRLQDPSWRNRFQREAKLASALNHPNILTIHDVGEDCGAPYIAAEYVEGTTLLQRMSTDKLSPTEAVEFGRQIAAAMAAAHAAGVIHRDLKPENLMIREDGLLKVLDFGLAKVSPNNSGFGEADQPSSAPTVSQPGTVMGTVYYMSPEQARGKDVDVSTDVFSFGIILFLMLTGNHPFEGETGTDVMAAILNRAPKPIDRTIPSDLSRLLMECLNKDASHRPSADGVCARLRKIQLSLTASSIAPAKNPQPSGDTTVVGLAASPTQALSDSDTHDLGTVRYARSGDVNIAWQTLGEGPIDIVFVMGWVSHLEWFWREPSFSDFLKRLATFSRVILFDKRGTGLSDKVPVNELPTLEQRMDDVRAVMDAAGSDKAVLCGVSEGGPMCTLFAATYPQKTIALTMIGCYARRLWAEDYPWGPTADQREIFLEEIGQKWGGPLGIEERAPTKAADPNFREWWASYLRMGASPGAAVALTKMNAQIDVRPILPNIQVPTLVIHRTGDRCLLVEEGRYMAERIPGAKFVELAGDDHLPFVGDANSILDEIEEFLTGRRHAPAVDRVLATVLCIAVDDGSERIKQFQEHVEREAELFRGLNLVAGDTEFLLTFDGPIRAVRAANAIAGLADRLNLNLRCGAHTAACDVGSQELSGPAVAQARVIASRAAIGSVLVSDTVRSLLSGSGLDFVECSALVHDELTESALYQLVR